MIYLLSVFAIAALAMLWFPLTWSTLLAVGIVAVVRMLAWAAVLLEEIAEDRHQQAEARRMEEMYPRMRRRTGGGGVRDDVLRAGHAYAERETGHHRRCLDRNERWGTCGACPHRDRDVFPEECQFTDRYDHHIAPAELGRIYQHHVDTYVEDHAYDRPHRS